MIKYKTSNGKTIKITKSGKVYVDGRYITPRSRFKFKVALTVYSIQGSAITVTSEFLGSPTGSRKLIGYWTDLRNLIRWFYSDSTRPFTISASNRSQIFTKPDIRKITYEVVDLNRTLKDYADFKYSKSYWSIYESPSYKTWKTLKFSKIRLLFKMITMRIWR